MTLIDPLDVTRAAAHDRQAFNRLVRSTQDLALGIALSRLSGRRADAEDAVQEAYLRAWTRLGDLREPAAFLPWFRKVVEHECRALVRRARPTAPLVDDIPQRESTEESVDLDETLAGLSPVEREALTLCAIAGHTVREVAGFLGVAESTVTSRLRNARARLRRDLLLMTETAISNARLPENYAETLPLPYDEYPYDARGAGVPSEFDFAWLPGVVSTEVLNSENVRASLSDGRVVRVQRTGRRGGIEDEAAVTPHLLEAGLPVPAIIAPPILADAPGGAMSAKTEPNGIPLLEWVSDSRRNPHDVEAACNLMLEVTERLRAITPAILADPACERLERCSLADELERTRSLGGPWMDHPEFADAIERITPIIDALPAEVVFSNGGNPPNVVNVDESGKLVQLWGFAWCRLEDPHYGVTKYWTYDIYPFRRFGYVERYLVRHGLTMREFAPRLAVRALATLQREVSVTGGDAEYRESLLGWLRMAMAQVA